MEISIAVEMTIKRSLGRIKKLITADKNLTNDEKIFIKNELEICALAGASYVFSKMDV